jgi:hypothetical protein
MILVNPRHSIVYDHLAGRVTLAFHGDRDMIVIEFAPEAVPGLINDLMRARHDAKRDRRQIPARFPRSGPDSKWPQPVRTATPGPLARHIGAHRR